MNELSAADRRRLTILLAVSDEANEVGPSSAIDVEQVRARLGEVGSGDKSAFSDEVTRLGQLGLVTLVPNLGGLGHVLLTARGRELATAAASARKDPIVRLRQLQDDYLRWLYMKTEREGQSPTTTDYLATGAGFLGTQYTAQELSTAGVRLKEAGVIEGGGRYMHPAPAHPKLTGKGRRIVETGRSVHDEPEVIPHIQNITTHVAGNANVANASPGASQTITITPSWAEQATELLDAIEQSIASFPDEMVTNLEALVADARDAVADNSPTRGRRALSVIASFLTDTASGALGGMLGAQALSLVALMAT